MTRNKRAIAVAAICALLVLSLGGFGQAMERAAVPSEKETCTISGTVGLPGVTMQGLPGDCVTDENGIYSAQVPSGWSGTIRPVKEGYTFAPPQRAYQRVTTEQTNHNYSASVFTFTISGNVGAPGVVLQGLPGDPVSDAEGTYLQMVPYGWSGSITPIKLGYTFKPPHRMYRRIMADYATQDYASEVITYTVSGNADIEGVAMMGLPGDPVTDAKGNYSAKVPYGWEGTVAPMRPDYEFDPPARTYTRVRGVMVNEDFHARARMLTISDVVAIGAGANAEPIADVTVTAEPGGTTAMTDSQGRYVIKVPYGWSGRLTASKPGFAIENPFVPYRNLTTHVVDGERIPASREPVLPLPKSPSVRPQAAVAGAAGEVVMIPTSQVDPAMLAQVKEDLGVMLQILREKLSEPRTILGVLYDYGDFFGSGGRQVEALYLQGYGAVFVMEASFPLSPASEAGAADGNEPQPAVDPVWQRARQRLYAPPGGTYGRRATPPQADRASFEEFKEDMVKTLKHAANIRHLGPEEWVILIILGQGEGPAGPFGPMSARNRYGGGGPYGGGYITGGSYSSGGGYAGSGGADMYSDSSSYSSGSFRMRTSPRSGRWPDTAPTAGTVLTILVKKADIDAFALGHLDFDEFSARVKTFSY